MKRVAKIVAGALFCAVAYPQALDLSSLDGLAAKARESTIVDLDGEKLKLGAKFLSSKDPDQSKAQAVISKLKGVFVRTFEFDSSSRPSLSDLDPIRAQLRGQGWSKIVDVRERDREQTEVYIHSTGGEMTGLAVLSVERDEVTVVNIVGPVDIDTLGELRGSLGIPRNVGPLKKPRKVK